MVLQMLILNISVGMLAYVIVAPLNPPIFFYMSVLVTAIGIWACFTLMQIKKEGLAVKIARPSEQRQNKYSYDNKGIDDKNRAVIFFAHVSAIKEANN